MDVEDDGAEPAPVRPGDAKILVLGDSIMAFNRETSETVADALGAASGVSVVDRSVGGAVFVGEDDIRGQYLDGDWSWVVFDGGGNDLGEVCGCDTCDGEAVLDRIASTDGREGALPEFLEEVTGQDPDVQVVVISYPDIPAGADEFTECPELFDSLRARQRATADRFPRVVSFLAGDVVRSNDRSAFADDGYHPSPRGSRLIGEGIAELIGAR